jgi:predicted RNase H-like HicB family nuclease
VRTKDSCWSVGTIYDPRELPGVNTVGQGLDEMLHELSQVACYCVVLFNFPQFMLTTDCLFS